MTEDYTATDKAIAGYLSPHFKVSELACKHCGRCSVTGRLVEALEQLRALGPEPIIIDDGYRCVDHNLNVGGAKNSQHQFGTAADLRIVGLTLQQQYERTKKVPDFFAGGIGVYDTNFIHVDVRSNGPARWARRCGVYLALATLVTP